MLNRKVYEKIDISLLKNQNELAVLIANYLSLENLEKINLEQISISEKRDISNKIDILYEIDFDNDCKLQIIDSLFIDKFPVERFTILQFTRNDDIKLLIKCKFSNSNLDYINEILIKAKNFKMHSSENDKFIVKKNIINNFSKKISSIISLDTLVEIKNVASFLSDELAILDHPNEKTRSINANECSLILDIEFGDFKLTARNNETKESYYMYFMFNRIGLSSIHLCLEKALQYKKQESRGV